MMIPAPRRYEVNKRNATALHPFVVVGQEQTAHEPAHCILIDTSTALHQPASESDHQRKATQIYCKVDEATPADTAQPAGMNTSRQTTASIDDLVCRYNMLCKLIETAPARYKGMDDEIRRQTIEEIQQDYNESTALLEQAGTHYYGIVAYLLARMRLVEACGNVIASVYPAIESQPAETPASRQECGKLFDAYMYPAIAIMEQERASEIEALRANGMNEEVSRMYADLYQQEEDALPASTNGIEAQPFYVAIVPYLNAFKAYLQAKIEHYTPAGIKSLQALILKNPAGVMRLLRHIVETYYTPASESRTAQGSAEIGSTIALLIDEGYLQEDKHLCNIFVDAFPQCKDIKWQGVRRYYAPTLSERAIASRKKDAMREEVLSMLE